jgi:hypothetical protein
MLQWLDLSFNRLSRVEPIVDSCPSLQVPAYVVCACVQFGFARRS